MELYSSLTDDLLKENTDATGLAILIHIPVELIQRCDPIDYSEIFSRKSRVEDPFAQTLIN